MVRMLDSRGMDERLVEGFRSLLPIAIGRLLALDTTLRPRHGREAFGADRLLALNAGSKAAIANALQHAKATLVRVTLSGDAHTLRLEVTDNGAGFASDTPAARPGHLGMVGMRERSIAIGARFEVRSSPDGGTSVCLAWEDGPS